MSCYSWAPGELEGLPLRSLSPVWVWLLWTMSPGAFDPFTWVLNMFSSRSKHLKSQTQIYFQTARMQLPFDNKVRDPILWTAVWCDDEYEKVFVELMQHVTWLVYQVVQFCRQRYQHGVPQIADLRQEKRLHTWTASLCPHVDRICMQRCHALSAFQTPKM